MKKIKACQIPSNSQLSKQLAQANFFDAHCMDNPHPDLHALELWIRIIERAPAWTNAAMRMRNAIVKRLGLKDLGVFSEVDRKKPIEAYAVGDQIGIFKILYLSESEVVMGDNDKHLNAQVSLLKTNDHKVVVSTVVHVHNTLGRIYMFFVRPAHRIIAPSMLSRIQS
jgi:hypothetical protein